MSDVDKCEGLDCELKEICYRFKSISNIPFQWWNNHKFNQQTKTCDFYWEVETKKTKK